MSGETITLRFDSRARDVLALWLLHIPASQAPKDLRKPLQVMYRDFDACKLLVGVLLCMRVADCKNQVELRELATSTLKHLDAQIEAGMDPKLVIETHKAKAGVQDE